MTDPFIYQYTVGGLVFAIGMYYATRQGYIGFSGRPLRNLLIAMLGLGFFAGLQGYLQYGDMGAGEWSVDDPKSEPLCAYPCTERFGERDSAELEKIEGILTVERDLKVLKEQLESKRIDQAGHDAETKEVLKRRKLGTGLDYGIMIGYFVLMLAIGTWFGRAQKTTKDFFFGGQKFAW